MWLMSMVTAVAGVTPFHSGALVLFVSSMVTTAAPVYRVTWSYGHCCITSEFFSADAGHHSLACFGCCRVWSVAHSHLRRTLCASASDDGTAALWGGQGLSTRAAAPLAPAAGCPVTCVDFCREDENALLVACADGAAYVYDLRNT